VRVLTDEVESESIVGVTLFISGSVKCLADSIGLADGEGVVGETIEIGRRIVGCANGLGLGDQLWVKDRGSSVAKALDAYYTCGPAYKLIRKSPHHACGIILPT